MTKSKPLKVVILALGAIVASSAASAATMQLVASGTVYGSYDETGIFGAPGGSLDGLTATMRLVFDTDQGFRDTEVSGAYDQVYGGVSYGIGSPAQSASLTIGGHTKSIPVSDWSQFYLCEAFWCGAEAAGAQAGGGMLVGDEWINETIGAYLYGFGMNLPQSIETPFTYAALPGAQGGAAFRLDSYDLNSWSYNYNTYVNFSIDSLSVSRIDVAPVPLPAAGLPLLAALGALGLAARRRRAAA